LCPLDKPGMDIFAAHRRREGMKVSLPLQVI
jgi:hypothetical protein